MDREPDGWHSLTAKQASAGSRYCYRIDEGYRVPDPASRFQPDDVHGSSEVIDPRAWHWTDAAWRGRPWHEAVIYELHVGSFTSRGDFSGVQAKLDYLMDLGVTALELMPIADFPGRRNWGYDGVAPFAPDSRYGRPENLKALVCAAHERGLAILLDVVYNHFGPEGNYLHRYAPEFFTDEMRTPWGSAINFDGASSHWVREFFIHNALYWLEEYRFDGLRLDAVHAIQDHSHPDVLTAIAERVRDSLPAARLVHLTLENDRNESHYLARDDSGRPRWFTAQWNDDMHHALHVIVTGESSGYYGDYAVDPLRHLARCLTEGFAYQGEPSVYRRHTRRGEPSAHLPPQAFVCFLQNHDQIGNRARGERIDSLVRQERVHAAMAIVLLAPSPPLLFMGQEWGARQPFPFFCDFSPNMAAQVTGGRRQGFEEGATLQVPAMDTPLTDPTDERAFTAAVLDWTLTTRSPHAESLRRHRQLLMLRQRKLMPRLAPRSTAEAEWRRLGAHAIRVHWVLADASRLELYANLADEALYGVTRPSAMPLYSTHTDTLEVYPDDALPAWCVTWYLQES